MENVLSVQLPEVGKIAAALSNPDTVGVSLGEAVVIGMIPTFALFELDVETGVLTMYTSGSFERPTFAINDDGYLEVTI